MPEILILNDLQLHCEYFADTFSLGNPDKRCTWPRNRAHGAVGQNQSRSIEWAEKQEKFRPKEMCFFLTSPFIELTRTELDAGTEV